MNSKQIRSIKMTKNSKIIYHPQFIKPEKADKLFERCKELELVKNPEIRLYGRTMKMNRSVGFYSDESDGYKYSGQKARSQPLPKFLKRVLDRVNRKMGTDYNGILINRYENGSESIGAHSDDEKFLSNHEVAGISLGAVRIVRFRGKRTVLNHNGKKYIDLKLDHGSLFAMIGDDFQRNYTHEIPKDLKIKDLRISLTFRHHMKYTH